MDDYSHFIGEKVVLEWDTIVNPLPWPEFGIFRGIENGWVYIETDRKNGSLQNYSLASVRDVRVLNIIGYEREVVRLLNVALIQKDFGSGYTPAWHSGEAFVRVDAVLLDTTVGGREDHVIILFRHLGRPECQFQVRAGAVGPQDPLNLDHSLAEDRVEAIRRELDAMIRLVPDILSECDPAQVVDLTEWTDV